MKRILAVLLTICLMVTIMPFTASAETEYTEGDYTYTVTDGKATITAVDTSISGDVTIPSTLGSYPVTSIGEYAFSWCESLTSITIPDSVTFIGVDAFSCCALTSITVDENNPVYHSAGNCLIKTESKTLIAGCKSSVIPTDGSVTRIGDGAFYGCTNLTNITIPYGVMSIGEEAFYWCFDLESITLPDSINSIGILAFFCCENLTSITIPDSVTLISNAAFGGCSSLNSITLPDRAMRFAFDTFEDSAYYDDENNWEDGVLYIGNHLIAAKDTLSGAYEIREGTINVACCAFSVCDLITSITIPDSVTYIGDRAFSRCDDLENVYFEKTEGWSVDGESISSVDLADSQMAAQLLTDTYSYNIWQAYVNGDLDGEAGKSANDAIYLLYNVFFDDVRYPLNQPCDFNGDGSVNANDAIYLLYNIFFGDVRYPLY